MNILIAEDDPVSRRLLEVSLKKWGYEVVTTGDGAAALSALTAPNAPSLAILDWMMPELDGPEVCRRARAAGSRAHIILLTAKGDKQDVADGLMAGADDYLTKPFDARELRARVHVGVRIIELQTSLKDHVMQLEAALASVKQLQGLLPICMYCKKVRDGDDYWQQVETYVMSRTDARFSHGICPTCYDDVCKKEIAELHSSPAE